MAFLLSFAGAGLRGAEPADAQIKGALDDIQRYENQFAAGGAVNAVTVNRTLKLLSLTRQRLDSSANKSHASWTEADARLNALITRLQGATNGSSSNAAPPAAPPPAARTNSATAAPPQMISQYRVRIQKLIRDIASAADTMDKNGVKPFQSATYVEEQLRIAMRFKESLAGYSDFASDADVVAAGEAVSRFENMIAFGQQQAAQQSSQVGDAQAALRALDDQLGHVAQPPSHPFTENAVRDWLVALAATRQSAAAALTQLAVLREHAYLPVQPGTVSEGSPYDMQDVGRLEAGYRGNVSKIDESLQQFSANLDLNVEHIADTLAFADRLDPTSEGDQTNSFLGAGAAARVREQFDAAQQLANVAMDYDRQLGRGELAAHTQVAQRVAQGRAHFDAKLARARELVRMPKAASTDKTLSTTAREALKNPDYEVGSIRRLVINADKVHREKKTSDQQFDKVDVSLSGTVTLSGTETTYFYSWDEFQVATAEPVGDTFFIFYNTLKNYSSGGSKTPLNRWILATRIQGSEIPEANINRD